MEVLQISTPSRAPEMPVLPNGYTRRQIASAISPRIQELILLPTEKCNFRCTYCYEDFKIGKMSSAVQSGIQKFLDRRVPELEQLRLSWFGGEPLLAKDVVLRIARHAFELCESYNVQFSGGLTTNAYLLSLPLAKELLALRQKSFQITLDGHGETHDVLRRRADGKGTFDVIWANLLALRSLDDRFDVSVRVHVRRDNLDNLAVLMDELAKAFKNDKRFRLNFQHLRDLGGEGGKTINNPVTLDEMPDIEANLLRIYRKSLSVHCGVPETAEDENYVAPQSLVRRTAGESYGNLPAGDHLADEPYICYAARPNSLMIRANGRIGKCTVALDDPRNDIGSIKPDGTLEIENPKLRAWIDGLGTLENRATACPFVTILESTVRGKKEIPSLVVA